MENFMLYIFCEFLGIVEVVWTNVDVTCHWSVKIRFLTKIINFIGSLQFIPADNVQHGTVSETPYTRRTVC